MFVFSEECNKLQDRPISSVKTYMASRNFGLTSRITYLLYIFVKERQQQPRKIRLENVLDT